jgi:hypothetical protein
MSVTVDNHAVVMQLFQQQAITIAKSGADVMLYCSTPDDANAVFEWLAAITGKYPTVDAWLGEIESHSVRQERVPDPSNTLPWLTAAFNAGCGLG